MSVLADTRREVADALAAVGFHADTVMPERPVPPLAVVLPGDEYVTQAEPRTFCVDFVVTLDVVLIMAAGANAAEVDALDAAIERVIVTLGTWNVTQVTPYRLNLNAGQPHLAANCTISNTVTIGED